jgi:hypothetical protein
LPVFALTIALAYALTRALRFRILSTAEQDQGSQVPISLAQIIIASLAPAAL